MHVSLCAALLGAAAPGVVSLALPQLSLPPLIPLIPGVTEPLSKNAPPLPILQLPTPPLPEVPYTPSNIKAKKIGYFWTASGDNQHADFLASFSLDDATFGTLLRLTPVPSSGNSPHHLGSSADGKYLWGGGLLSLLKTQDTGYYFDVSDPYNPAFYKSDRALLGSISDDVVAKPDGGFFYTYMGSAVGTSPGRLIETDKNLNIIHEWPEDTAGILDVLGHQFSPHGLAVDFKNGFIWTSDFVIPITVLKPSAGIVGGDSVRLWDLKTRTILNTIKIPNGGGIQDVKLIPNHPEGAALATAVHLGQIWILFPKRIDPATGKPGVAQLFFDLGDKARDTVAIFSAITNDAKYMYVTATTANHVYSLDISDVNNPKRLDDPNVVQPIVGPHFLKITPDQKNVVVTDYFVQTGDIGILNTASDYTAQFIDILPNGNLHFNRSINFSQVFANRGGAKPHSTVVFDLTDPKNPKFDTGAYPGAGTIYNY